MKSKFQIILLILTFISLAQIASANFRDIDSPDFGDDYVASNMNYAARTMQAPAFETLNLTHDNNKKIYSVVEKSQILNFETPISRVSMTNDSFADIVVLSPKQLMINGKKPGSTSVLFWSNNNPNPTIYNLVVQQNAEPFIQALEHITPNENISVMFNDEGAVLTGKISSTSVRKKILDLAKAYQIHITDITESPAKQVLLEVKVTEASKNFTRDIGVNLIGGSNILPQNYASRGYADNLLKKSYYGATGDNGLLLGYFKPGKLGVDIQASEAKGDIKILAEPRLLAVNGEEGSFSVGNQVPIPSSVGNYGNISYTYKDTGVILKFTPTIMEESGRIRLKLNPEVSEVDNSVTVTSSLGTAVYGFKTRKVETTVELMDGETLIIAGLTSNTSSKSKNQVPLFGNIPILGAFFSTTNEKKDNNELVIFITPKIVDNSVSMDTL